MAKLGIPRTTPDGDRFACATHHEKRQLGINHEQFPLTPVFSWFVLTDVTNPSGLTAMKSILLAAAGIAGLVAALPAGAAEPAPRSDPDTITFEQYRDWRLHFIEERQMQIAARLADNTITGPQRERLDRQKTYYDGQAAMAAAARDRLFRARFDRIDTNHDGKIDRAERTAWHERQQAYYRHEAAARDGSH
jgi:hypothetical protein